VYKIILMPLGNHGAVDLFLLLSIVQCFVGQHPLGLRFLSFERVLWPHRVGGARVERQKGNSHSCTNGSGPTLPFLDLCRN
jgi:hypothetical protein